MGRPMIMPNEEPLPPQIQEPLDQYLDESGAIATIALPLSHLVETTEDNELDAFAKHGSGIEGDVFAMVFLEYFTKQPPKSVNPAMQVVCGEATLALANSLEHSKVFGLRFWKLLGVLLQGKRAVFAALALMAIIGLGVAGAWIEIEHEVIASGSLLPTEKSQVFANVDGIVKELYVSDGDSVSAGDKLFLLENADLETRAENLVGQIQTTTKRLSSVQALRLDPSIEATQANRLAIEERQLESELGNLRDQHALIKNQQAELTIVSPIDGTVSGWQLERQLADRPVSRGNLLVSIVNQEGPWSLRLQVPDKDAGPVLECLREQPTLALRFAVATQPESTFSGTLDSLSTAARQNDDGENVLDANASVHMEEIAELRTFQSTDGRVGADVTAKIQCGKRSVLRSWFGDVFDFAHRNILFYFR